MKQIKHEEYEYAVLLALTYHSKQLDKSGVPYVDHLFSVAEIVEKNLSEERELSETFTSSSYLELLHDAKVVALLHDILEDTDCEERYLRKPLAHEQPIVMLEDGKTLEWVGFSDNVLEAVKLLTKPKDYDSKNSKEYYQAIKANPLARRVKIADLLHNTTLTRIKHLKPKDIRRTKQYLSYLEYLI